MDQINSFLESRENKDLYYVGGWTKHLLDFLIHQQSNHFSLGIKSRSPGNSAGENDEPTQHFAPPWTGPSLSGPCYLQISSKKYAIIFTQVFIL